MVHLVGVFAGLEGPMEKTLGLRGYFLPHRKDNILELEPLLAIMLNLGIFMNASTLIPL